MNDYIWLICYFVACTVTFVSLCISDAKDRCHLKVKDVGIFALIAYAPPFSVFAIILGVCYWFEQLKELVIWERKED